MISKELMTIILDREVVHCFMMKEDDNEIYYRHDNTIGSLYINIYELAYKCKQLAYSLGYDLVSTNTSNDSNYCTYCYILGKDWRFGVDDFNDRIAYKSGLTEPEAIFKACQWVLDNKGVK